MTTTDTTAVRVLETQTAAPAATPAMLLSMAVQQNADLQKLEKLMELQERWEANEARKAYHAAVAAFKANPPTIVKDRKNAQYDSRYPSIDSLVNTASPVLSQHGLTARWEFSQDQRITVTCILTHVKGHSERVSLSGSPDDSGKKNSLQQIKSTVTYLEIATFSAVTGLVSSDATDDDGNGAGEVETLSEQQLADMKALIDEVKADVPVFLEYLSSSGKATITRVDEIPATMYSQAVKLLERKRKQKPKDSP